MHVSEITLNKLSFPNGSGGKEPTYTQETQEARVRSLSREDPLEEEMAATPVFLPGHSHGQRVLVGYSPPGRKESDRTEHQRSSSLHIGLKQNLKPPNLHSKRSTQPALFTALHDLTR